MQTVQVLISTYNGEKYIKKQIDSLLNQIGVKVKILVRDDGSTDSTKAILEQYSKLGKLKWYEGKNLRTAHSFLDLMKNANDVEYYAFCDQDDIWDNDKLIIAIESLKKFNKNEPIMYFSNARLIDKNDNDLNKNHIKNNPRITLKNSFLQNIALGCTIVFNKEALKKAILADESTDIVMHDAWVYRICMALGKVVYDPMPHIGYRQHQNNVIGGSESVLKKYKSRIFNISKSNLFKKSKRIKVFLDIYGDMLSKDTLETIKSMAEYNEKFKLKLKLIFDPEVCMQCKIDTLILKIGILIGVI